MASKMKTAELKERIRLNLESLEKLHKKKNIELKGDPSLMGIDGEYFSVRTAENKRPDLTELFRDLYHETIETIGVLKEVYSQLGSAINQEAQPGIQKTDKPSQIEASADDKSLPNEKETNRRKTENTNFEEKVTLLEKENEELRKKLTSSTKFLLVEEITEKIDRNMSEQALFRELATKNSEMIDRLASEMNAKLSSDETALENISIKNRPMNIVEDFSLLMSNAWLDAKEALDKTDKANEAGKVKLLNNIMMASLQMATTMHRSMIENVTNLLRNPLISASAKVHVSASRNEKPLPDVVLNVVGDYVRAKVDVERKQWASHLEEFKMKLTSPESAERKQAIRERLRLKNVEDYIYICLALAWKMVLQRPQMSFKMPYKIGEKWKKQPEVDLLFGSQPKKAGAEIKYFKQPCLYHGKQLMAKGIVFVS